MFSRIKDIEYFLPKNIETNIEFYKKHKIRNLKKINDKLGIKKRSITSNNENVIQISVNAASKILKKYKNIKIDFLILVTQTSDIRIPTSACIIQEKLRIKDDILAYDINLGCSGFIYALDIASMYIETERAKNGLIICADTYSKFIDKNDRVCKPIFSDGASAILISTSRKKRIFKNILGSDGRGAFSFFIPNKKTKRINAKVNKIYMNGSEIALFTMNTIPKYFNKTLYINNLSLKDIKLVVFHQASKYIIDNLSRILNIPEKKVLRNYQLKGNLVSASIPVALKDSISRKNIKKGDKIILVGFGVGLSWGCSIIEL